MNERFWEVLKVISMVLASILILGNLLLGLYVLDELNEEKEFTLNYIKVNNNIWDSQQKINDLDRNMISTIIDEIVWIEKELNMDVRK